MQKLVIEYMHLIDKYTNNGIMKEIIDSILINGKITKLFI